MDVKKRCLITFLVGLFLIPVVVHADQIQCGKVKDTIIPCFIPGQLNLNKIPSENKFPPSDGLHVVFDEAPKLLGVNGKDGAILRWGQSSQSDMAKSQLTYTPVSVGTETTNGIEVNFGDPIKFGVVSFRNEEILDKTGAEVDIWNIGFELSEINFQGSTSGGLYTVPGKEFTFQVSETLNTLENPNDFLKLLDVNNVNCEDEGNTSKPICLGTPESHITTGNLIGTIPAPAGGAADDTLLITGYKPDPASPVSLSTSSFFTANSISGFAENNTPILLEITDLHFENVRTSPIPEPGTILLLGSGLVVLATWRKHRISKLQG